MVIFLEKDISFTIWTSMMDDIGHRFYPFKLKNVKIDIFWYQKCHF